MAQGQGEGRWINKRKKFLIAKSSSYSGRASEKHTAASFRQEDLLLADEAPFQTQKQFERWAFSGRKDHIPFLMSRLLLRSFPFLGRILKEETATNSLRQISSTVVFQTSMVCWSASALEGPLVPEGQLLASLRNAVEALEILNSGNSSSDLVKLASEVANSFLFYDPLECVVPAVDAAVQAGVGSLGSDNAVWDMIAMDASLLDRGIASAKVAVMPLWPAGNPFWFDSAVRSMSAELLTLSDSWNELLDWYATRVAGGLIRGLGKEGEIQIARRLIAQNSLWWSGLENTAAEIAEWLVAERLRLGGQSNIGNIWEAGEKYLVLAQQGDEADAEVAHSRVAVQLHDGIKRRIADFISVAQEIEDINGWDRFADKFQRFADTLSCPTASLPDSLGRIYDASIEIASFLDQDNDLRKGAWGNASALDANRRREFENIVIAVGPWLRQFPTVRELDDAAGAYLGNVHNKTLAVQLLAEAGNQALISEGDRLLLEDILSILETRGHLSQKAVRRGTHTVGNLVIAAVTLVGTFYSGAIASDFAGKSKLVQRAGDFLVRTEGAAIEYLREVQPDIRHSVEVIINRAKEQRRREPSAPIEPEPLRRPPLGSRDD